MKALREDNETKTVQAPVAHIYSARIKARLGNGDIIESPPLDDSWEEMTGHKWRDGECVLSKSVPSRFQLETIWDEIFDIEAGSGFEFKCWWSDMRMVLKEVKIEGNVRTQASILEVRTYRQEMKPMLAEIHTPTPSVVSPEWPEGNHPRRRIFESKG